MAPDVRATSDVTSVVGNFYDKVMLERLVARAIMYNLAEKRPMPKGISTTINMNRFTNFPTVTSKITEGEVPTQTYLSGTAVSATVFQLGAWTPVSDLLELTSFSNVIKECVENFGDSAAVSVDTWIYWSLMSEAAVESPAGYFGGMDVAISTWFNAKQGGLSSIFISADGLTISAYGTMYSLLSAGANATVDGYGLDLDKVNRAVTKLRAQDVRPFSDGFYKMVVHPKQVATIIRTTEWASWNQYVRPEVLDKGEFGRAYGVRFYESTIVPQLLTGGLSMNAVGLCAYFAPIWGQGAFAVTEIDTEKGIKTYVKAPNKYDTGNPIDQWSTIGWKITMAAKTLNPKCGYFIMTLG